GLRRRAERSRALLPEDRPEGGIPSPGDPRRDGRRARKRRGPAFRGEPGPDLLSGKATPGAPAARPLAVRGRLRAPLAFRSARAEPGGDQHETGPDPARASGLLGARLGGKGLTHG